LGTAYSSLATANALLSDTIGFWPRDRFVACQVLRYGAVTWACGGLAAESVVQGGIGG